MLDAIAAKDAAALGAIPRDRLRSGNSEILNWVTAAGALEGLTATIVDYVPGYRTPAGTGTGMAFARWLTSTPPAPPRLILPLPSCFPSPQLRGGSTMSTPTMTIPQGIRLSGSRMTVVTAALLFALLGYSIPSNMLVPLVTSLEAAYHISAVAAIWISLIALLSGAAFVPTLCRLGDTMGWKKSLVIVGLACLAVGALIAAVSSSLPLLLVGRAITGVGLVLFPMLAGIINDEFPVIRRKVAISLMSAFLFLGLGVGGVIAGLIVEHHASFRIVFWGACVLAVLGIVGMVFLVPNGRGRPAGAPDHWWQSVDPFGAVGFAIPAIALDIAFSEEPTWGWGSWEVIFLIVIAVVVAIAWVIVERRVKNPLVDQTVFWSRPMWVNNAVSVLAGFGLFGALVATSTFAQLPHVPGLNGLGAGPVVGALVIVPVEWLMIVMGPVTGYLSRFSGKGPFLFAAAWSRVSGCCW